MSVVAAIDVGSNAIRLVTVRLSEHGKVLSNDFQRYAVRLGGDVFSKGLVSEERTTAVLEAFDDIRKRLKENKVESYRAVATAAVREAHNGKDLVARIKSRTGIDVEIIDGRRESSMSRQALLRAVGWAPSDAVIVDLGGGTLELERVQRGRGISLPLGTVRLVERFPELGQSLSAARLRHYARVIAELLAQATRMRQKAPLLIGTGGNLTFLADTVPLAGAMVPSIDVRRLPAFAERLADMTPAARAMAFGLRPDRAELVVAGALVIHALVQRFGAKRFVVPGSGLREHLLHQLTDPREPAQARLGPVAKVARELFETTAGLHRLWRPALPALLEAARLVPAPGRRTVPGRKKPVSPLAEAIAALATGSDGGPALATLGADDREVAMQCAALLGLAADIVAHRGRRMRHAEVLGRPMILEFGLRGRLRPAVVRRAAGTLGCELKVV